MIVTMGIQLLAQLLRFNNNLSLLERICGCVIRKIKKSHYESSGWYHYTCFHSNCPLNIVLLQQHVFIISEHPNGSNIIRAGLMAELCFVQLCLIRVNGLLISLRVTQKNAAKIQNRTPRLCQCVIQSHYQ